MAIPPRRLPYSGSQTAKRLWTSNPVPRGCGDSSKRAKVNLLTKPTPAGPRGMDRPVKRKMRPREGRASSMCPEMSGEQLPLRFRVNAKPITIRYPTHNSLRLATTGEPMPPATKECELQAAARRCGLKLVLDRYSAAATGYDRYFLRPIWD